MHDIHYEPNLVTIPANQPVTIVLVNTGEADHSFLITDHKNPGFENLDFKADVHRGDHHDEEDDDHVGITIDLDPGETASVTVNAPAGNYYFNCDEPGHEAAGMFGYLQVKDGAQISTETATVTPRAGS